MTIYCIYIVNFWITLTTGKKIQLILGINFTRLLTSIQNVILLK